MSLKEILNKINPRKLFLIDSLGALLSAILLGLILARFEHIFGMPQKVLYFLSFIACLFAAYSGICYLGKLGNWRPYMKIIAIANLLYCCLTVALVFYFGQQLSILGFLYFVPELMLVTVLAMIELKTASHLVYKGEVKPLPHIVIKK